MNTVSYSYEYSVCMQYTHKALDMCMCRTEMCAPSLGRSWWSSYWCGSQFRLNIYFSEIPNTNKINHQLSHKLPVKWNSVITHLSVSIHYPWKKKERKKRNITNIPLTQNCITICLPSLATYCRMEMMSDFTITAICRMRTITSECRTYLCL